MAKIRYVKVVQFKMFVIKQAKAQVKIFIQIVKQEKPCNICDAKKYSKKYITITTHLCSLLV